MAKLTPIQEGLLTTGDATQGQLLIPRTIASVLWEETEQFRFGAELAAIRFGPEDIKGSSIDLNRETLRSMVVREVAEGAPIPLDVSEYSTINIRPRKYGIRPLITKDMIEDAQWSLIEQNLRAAGRKMAEHDTGLILTALDGATNVVTGGANATIANITRLQQYLEDADFKPTDLLVGPEVLNDLRNIDTFAEADKFGTREMQERGIVGRLYGMDVVLFSGNIGTSTRAYVIDRNHAFAWAEKRPVLVEQYDDKVHDLAGAVITKRVAAALLRDTAVARLTTT